MCILGNYKLLLVFFILLHNFQLFFWFFKNSITLLFSYFFFLNRRSIALRGMDRTTDDKFFRIKELNSTTIQILLIKSLNDLVDSDSPQNILKFKLQCVSLVSNNRNDDVSTFKLKWKLIVFILIYFLSIVLDVIFNSNSIY